MTNSIKRLWSEESGQGLAEYGLILGLVALAVVGLLTTMGGSLESIFTKISTKLTGADGDVTP